MQLIDDVTPASVMPGVMAGSVVVIGVLDGVHLGHQQLLRRAQEVAGELPVVVLTFDPHPSVVLGQRVVPVLTDLREREALVRSAGADEMVVLQFTSTRASQSPADFITEVLQSQLNAAHVVVGENFTFGHRASGTVETLKSVATFETHVEPLMVDSGGTVTSTRVRGALAAGDISETSRLLGRRYRVCGEVVHGHHRGRELGYPTANVAVTPERALPADGVYAGRVFLAGELVGSPAAISLGQNSTFGSTERTLEAYVIGTHDLDLYGKELCVEFVQILRPMQTFASAEDLVAQMKEDVSAAKDLLAASD